MSSPKQPAIVQVNPRIPPVLGIINMILGATLLIYWLFSIGWTVAQPSLEEHLQSNFQTNRLQKMAAIDARVASLHADERRETSEARKAQLRTEIVALETELDLEYGDLRDRLDDDPRIATPYWIDAIAGVLLNSLLIVSGIGLMALRPWSRRLALGLASVKLVLLSIGLTYAFLVTIPLNAASVRSALRRQEIRQGSPLRVPTAVASAKITAASMATFTATGFLAAGAFPALTIWLLNKPTVTAVFRLASPRRPAAEPDRTISSLT